VADSLEPDQSSTVNPTSDTELLVRKYNGADYTACRSLWVELTEHHRRIYRDPSIGGDDPGEGFDAYLATPQRWRSWVAELDGTVVGLTGLFDWGKSAEVEPVVVTESARDQGIGRVPIDRVVLEARLRKFEYVAIRPVARNVGAIRRFHAAGFRTLGGHIDMTMDLIDGRQEWFSGASLHDLDFEY
jgi:GNAT superfamily N-acetyltransferase